MPDTPCRIGLTGLAVMGQNLARNIARRGFPIAVHNRTTSRTEAFLQQFGAEGPIRAAGTLQQLAHALERPRAVIIMVKAGPPVDAVIHEILPHLEPGDILIDGGNSHFLDTRRREQELAGRGIQLLGTGISGGEEGALHGPSIMPGGPRQAYDRVADILTAIAARVDGEPCCAYVGPDGAGHFVKMVHNGIEYADMQLIAEAYDLMASGLGMPAQEIAAVFGEWNQGELDSYLVQITAEVLAKRDESTGRPLVDMILDVAEQKGTGRWTSQVALDLGVPLMTVTEAVFARFLSAMKEERMAASRALPGPPRSPGLSGQDLLRAVRDGLYASKIACYAQGFQMLAAAGTEHNWPLRPGELASIWRGGCIIRARFLNRIRDAFARNPDLPNLLLDDYFRGEIESRQSAWRHSVAEAVRLGIPVPAFSSALAYYDSCRRERLPANLIQGLRDYFGAHNYARVDRPGKFHTRWAQDGREVPAD